MRKRMLLSYVVLLIISLLAFSACGEQKNENENNRKKEFEKIDYTLPETKTVRCFTLTEEGELWILDWEEKLTQYGIAGIAEETFEEENFVGTTAMICVGDKLYLAQQEEELIREWDIATGEFSERVVEVEFSSGSIRNMVAAENQLFVLTDNKLIAVNFEKAKSTVLPITNISAIYGASDGKLYYCRETSTSTAIFCYDAEGVENETFDLNETICDLTDLVKGDNVRSFVLEKDYLAYSLYKGKQVKVLKISECKVGTVQENAAIFNGREMQCAAGNVVYYRSGMTSEEVSLESFYLPEIPLEEQKQDEASGNKGTEEEQDLAILPINPQAEGLSGTIKIATTDSSTYYNIANVNRIGNIKAELYENDYDYKTELMAGDDTYDIYFLYYNWADVQELKKVGYYVPLSDSGIISEYCGNCFDYIEEAVTADNGDIFALPLSIFSQVVWYVPENFEKYDLDTADLDHYESYLDLSVKSREYEEQGVTQSYSFVSLLLNQYEMYYNDYNNGFVDFKTDFYRALYDKLWTGWKIYSQTPTHPMLNDEIEDEGYQYNYEDSVVNKKDRVLFTMGYFDNEDIGLRTEEGWRVKSAPTLSDECNPNLVYGVCAIINPASKNKELAMAYLETIAANPSCAINHYADLFFEDKSIYENRRYFKEDEDYVYEYSYDMSSQVMSDLYDIFKNGVVAYGPFSGSIIVADEYQNGRYTLEEAIDELQRQMEMQLNE